MAIIFITVLFMLFFVIAWKKSNLEVISPSFLFMVPFIVTMLVAFVYRDEWDLNLSVITIAVLVLGCFSFCLGTYIVNSIKFKNDFSVFSTRKIERDEFLKHTLVLLFLIFAFAFKFYEFGRMTGTYNIPTMMTIMRTGTVNGNTTFSFSLPLLLVGGLSYTSGFISALFLARKLVFWKTDHRYWFIVLVNLLLSIFTYLLGGARGGAYSIILAFVYGIVYSYYSKTQWKKRVPLKYILIITVFVFVFLIEYRNLGILMGKSYLVDYSNAEYISVYIGAQIKNLDIAVRSGYSSSVFGQETFATFVQFFSKYFGTGEYASYSLYLPFNAVNGHNIGNVATTFFPYYLDFGIGGVIIISLLFGIIAQFAYVKAKSGKDSYFSFYNIIFAYMTYSLLFSFFSDKFFEEVISLNFVRYFACLVIWYIYYEKISFTSSDFKGSFYSRIIG